jgi:hypothetical protein
VSTHDRLTVSEEVEIPPVLKDHFWVVILGCPLKTGLTVSEDDKPPVLKDHFWVVHGVVLSKQV